MKDTIRGRINSCSLIGWYLVLNIHVIADGALCHRRGRELYCVILWSALPKVPCLKKKKIHPKFKSGL